jgi:hypothetical protein
MGEATLGFKSIEVGVYPGGGVLYPRWESTERFSQNLNKMITIERDLRVVSGDKGDSPRQCIGEPQVT